MASYTLTDMKKNTITADADGAFIFQVPELADNEATGRRLKIGKIKFDEKYYGEGKFDVITNNSYLKIRANGDIMFVKRHFDLDAEAASPDGGFTFTIDYFFEPEDPATGTTAHGSIKAELEVTDEREPQITMKIDQNPAYYKLSEYKLSEHTSSDEILATITATDGDGQAPTVSLKDPKYREYFEILTDKDNANKKYLMVKDPDKLDFDNNPDLQGTVDLTIIAKNEGNEQEQTISFTMVDENDAISFVEVTGDLFIDEDISAVAEHAKRTRDLPTPAPSVVAVVQAEDVNGNKVTFHLEGEFKDWFIISNEDGTKGQITVRNPKLIDHEYSGLKDGKLELTIVATSDTPFGDKGEKGRSEMTVEIKVRDFDEAPQAAAIITLNPEFETKGISEDVVGVGVGNEKNPPIVIATYSYSATDPEGTHTSVSLPQSLKNTFVVVPDKDQPTGRILLKKDVKLDYESIGDSLDITLITTSQTLASDVANISTKPQFVESATVSLTVLDKDYPTSFDMNTLSANVSEIAPIGETFATIGVNDDDVGDTFEFRLADDYDGPLQVSADGQVSLREAVDYEALAKIGDTDLTAVVFVTTKNSKGVEVSSDVSATLTVEVVDGDDAPTVSLNWATTTLNEHTPDTPVSQGQKLADVRGEDEDAAHPSDTVKLFLTGENQDLFKLRDNQLFAADPELFDYEAFENGQVTVNIRAVSPFTSGSSPKDTKEKFVLQLNDVDDTPVFSSDDFTFTVAEGTSVIGQLVATDPHGDALTYTLIDDDGEPSDKFMVDAEGYIRLKNGEALDYETLLLDDKAQITLTAKVSDATHADADSANVIINVTDVYARIDDIEYLNSPIDEDLVQASDKGKVVIRVDAEAVNAPDGTALAYALGGDDAAYYTIDAATGEIRLKTDAEITAANLEIASTAAHKLTVTVSLVGEDDASHSFDFTVNVVDVGVKGDVETYEGKPTEGDGIDEADKDGDEVRYKDTTASVATKYGSYVVTGGVLTWTPNAKLDFNGADSLSEKVDVTVIDDRAGEGTRKITFTVLSAIQINGIFEARENSPWRDPDGEIEVLDNDRDLTNYAATATASYGTIEINADGTWSYTLDNTNPAVEGLHGRENENGHTLTETVTVTLTRKDDPNTPENEADTDTLIRSFNITISGLTDYYTSDGQYYGGQYYGFGHGWNRGVTQGLSEHLSITNDGSVRVIYGGSGDDVLNGHTGNNELHGDAGNDVLNGGDGNDQLFGGLGNDVLIGGEGYDSAVIVFTITDPASPVGFVIDMTDRGVRFKREADGSFTKGKGDDFIYQRFWLNLDGDDDGGDVDENGREIRDDDDEYDYVTGIERFNIHGNYGNDMLTGGNGGADLRGWAGNDVLNGGDGHDQLYGGSGNDVLNGGDGNDRLYGEEPHNYHRASGNDVLNGGAGDDWFDGGYGNDVLNGGDGDDKAYLHYYATAEDVAIKSDLTLDLSDETRWKKNDDGTWSKGEGDDFIYQRLWFNLDGDDDGGDVDENGREIRDDDDDYDYVTSIEHFIITGSWLGNNVLTGGAGNDSFYGNKGNDVFDGGAGDDLFRGDDGNDIFVLGTATEGLDTVADFRNVGDNDQIRVDVSDSQKTNIEAQSTDAAKLAKLQEAAQIRWTQTDNLNGHESKNDTIIYATKGTTDTADDVAIMVLVDVIEDLTIDMFEIV